MSSDGTQKIAGRIMDFVFEAVRHGDAKHQEWLRAKCTELEPKIECLLQGETEVTSWDQAVASLAVAVYSKDYLAGSVDGVEVAVSRAEAILLLVQDRRKRGTD
jgi:hypothetical protein